MEEQVQYGAKPGCRVVKRDPEELLRDTRKEIAVCKSLQRSLVEFVKIGGAYQVDETESFTAVFLGRVEMMIIELEADLEAGQNGRV